MAATSSRCGRASRAPRRSTPPTSARRSSRSTSSRNDRRVIGRPSVRRFALTSIVCACTATLLACRHTPATVHAKAASASLRRLYHDVDEILSTPTLERGYWGVLVKSLATGDTLYALNARKLMMPASTLKLVTLAAAAERLGWDYSYETSL